MDDESGIVIEPLSNEEKRDQGATSVQNNPENDADYPKDWRGKPIAEIVGKGFKYHKRVQRNGKTYMVLRRGRHDKGLGLWSQEKEDKLFGYYPHLALIGD